MRVLMISDVYFPRVNGVSTSIQTFRRDLAALGSDSWLIAPDYPEARDDEPGVLRQPSRYLVFDPEDRIMSANAAERACRGFGDVDVVHIQTPFIAHRVGLKAAAMLGRPSLETYHTFFEEYLHHYLPLVPHGVSRGVARWISRRQCNAVDAVVAPSRQLADVLAGYGVTTPIEVIPTGLDLGEFTGGDGAAFRQRHGIGSRPVMLLVSRIAHEKNIGFLVRVLGEVRKQVPHVLFVIAGEGPALPALRRLVADAALTANVLFVGYLDRCGALRDCYRSADVFVFASRTETQGLVLLEALALGVPVVSTAVLGTKEVLSEARGAVVVREEAAQFAGAVVDVLTRPERRAALAAQGRDFVAKSWSSLECAKRLTTLYAKLSDASLRCGGVGRSIARAGRAAAAIGETLPDPIDRRDP